MVRFGISCTGKRGQDPYATAGETPALLQLNHYLNLDVDSRFRASESQQDVVAPLAKACGIATLPMQIKYNQSVIQRACKFVVGCYCSNEALPPIVFGNRVSSCAATDKPSM